MLHPAQGLTPRGGAWAGRGRGSGMKPAATTYDEDRAGRAGAGASAGEAKATAGAGGVAILAAECCPATGFCSATSLLELLEVPERPELREAPCGKPAGPDAADPDASGPDAGSAASSSPRASLTLLPDPAEDCPASPPSFAGPSRRGASCAATAMAGGSFTSQRQSRWPPRRCARSTWT